MKIQKHKWSLGTFLRDLFADGENSVYNSLTRTQMVSKFLGGHVGVEVEKIIEPMYMHKYSRLKKSCALQNHPVCNAENVDLKLKAQQRLQEWAIEKVEEMVDVEAVAMSGKDMEFQLDEAQNSWEFLHTFSMSKFMAIAEERGPTSGLTG